MILNDEVCYRIIQSRDARYDGCFFTGVMTTGIYCRPVCPAGTPKRENVRFYSCAAAAEAAGFRPCKRCRPETAPGTPAWAGTSASVTRALRLISEGYLDEHSVSELASILGMGPRHLGRLFAEHLGASPTRLALSRRTHFAAKLLWETDLSITHVAFGAGFGSVRRFNTAFRQVFHEPPSSVRRVTAGGAAERSEDRSVASSAALLAPPGASRIGARSVRLAASKGIQGADGSLQPRVKRRTSAARPSPALSLSLAYRPPYPWQQVLSFYRLRAVAGVEVVDDTCYRRSIAFGGSHGILEVRMGAAGSNELEVRVEGVEPVYLKRIADRVRRMFDLDADPVTIGAHLSRDARLVPLVEALPGVRIPGMWTLFEAAMRAIVGQQVSVAAACTARARLSGRYGRRLDRPTPDGIELLYPTPEAIAEADLAWFGAPASRKRSLLVVARFLAGNAEALGRSLPLEDAVTSLAALPGIGPWSAQYIALRGLGHPDAFPESDLVLRRALDGIGVPRARGLRNEALEAWRPWRGYAATYLWTTHVQSTGG